MHDDWKGPYSRRLQKKASERGRRMAEGRWNKDRERRAGLARMTAEQSPNRIVRRIMVREAVIWEWDSAREARRKIRRVLQTIADSR
jgi:hypothetical protein